MVDFFIDFFSILVQFWEPSWSHVGHFFAQNTGGLTEGRGFFGGSSFFIDFFAVLAPFRLHFGASGPHLGSIFEGFWFHFGSIFAAKLTDVGWAGGVMRSVKNYII